MKSVNDLSIGPARESDLESIFLLLQSLSLPTSGVRENIGSFVVAKDGGRLVACSGAEAFQFAALVRSVAVDPEYRSMGLGRRMVREILDRLSSLGLREFYLLTTDAEGWFRKRGFKVIDRDEVHPQLLQSSELQGETCSSAICMRLVMT
jgi:amino-acid N-acetyltransferase